jgi:hypothetical protein
VSDLYVYSQDRSTYFLQQNRQINRGNMNVEIVTVAAQFYFLGIFVSNFWYCLFAVWTKIKQERVV